MNHISNLEFWIALDSKSYLQKKKKNDVVKGICGWHAGHEEA